MLRVALSLSKRVLCAGDFYAALCSGLIAVAAPKGQEKGNLPAPGWNDVVHAGIGDELTQMLMHVAHDHKDELVQRALLSIRAGPSACQRRGIRGGNLRLRMLECLFDGRHQFCFVGRSTK